MPRNNIKYVQRSLTCLQKRTVWRFGFWNRFWITSFSKQQCEVISLYQFYIQQYYSWLGIIGWKFTWSGIGNRTYWFICDFSKVFQPFVLVVFTNSQFPYVFLPSIVHEGTSINDNKCLQPSEMTYLLRPDTFKWF